MGAAHNPVEEFRSERTVHTQSPAFDRLLRAVTGVRVAIIGLSLIALAQAAFLIRGMNSVDASPLAPAGGVVTIQSTPPGAAVFVDGRDRGVTPLVLTLEPGKYAVRVAQGSISRDLPVTVSRGASSTQHVMFGESPVTPTSGGLSVTSQPAGVRVNIDGRPVGVTPVEIRDLQPGPHVVVLDGASSTSRQNVVVQAGTKSVLAVTMPVAGVGAGWVSVQSPIDVQLFENGALIGSSQTERVMLPAGKHVLEAVNNSLGYRATQTVQVVPGRAATLQIAPPPATVNINATPWAEVTAGARALGVTPLGNVSLPIGTHEIVFRHPQLGERKVSTTVTLQGPNRVGVNMNER